MKPTTAFAAIAVSALCVSTRAHAADLDKLKLLFVGDPGTPRAQHFAGFLKENVGHVEIAARRSFKPEQADEFEVVLLDWPQSETTREEWLQPRAPLGERKAWTKPTVLLGSAGLNLAVVWKVRGGSG